MVEGTGSGTASQKGPVKRKLMERLAFRLYAFAWSSQWLYEFGTRIARLLQRPTVRDGSIGKVGRLIGALVPPLAAWTAWRDAPPIAPSTFREQWRNGLSELAQRK